jgi:hypothetical protein
MPSLYEIACRLGLAYVVSAPRWYVAAKPFFRCMRFAADVLPSVARRADFPPYLAEHVRVAADVLNGLVGAWRREVDAYNDAPLLCTVCSAPVSGQKSGPGPCERCPAHLRPIV